MAASNYEVINYKKNQCKKNFVACMATGDEEKENLGIIYPELVPVLINVIS